ncbi:type II toxin-antitoxin system VapC family toxin [Candidatus Symbiobacter mobilis]|uniref:PilT domain protein n=1 Tax=Candidatus Symbiobacter mobilis CR TaxID=946483 RepID=U5NAY8_9BURK|nr:type II toxin-antitoxin system VapC family toxin [Candidatus Symbiobacter mobilis]AGX88475.1 PilT domain protein [Candidatus Symbiobacter mobilis CR]
MILFCDTSALIKLYVLEAFSAEVHARAAIAKAVAVSRIAWAEAMAALARRVRENSVDAEAVEAVRAKLRDDWPMFAIVEVTQTIVEQAGEYADTFALRGYDSVQLAAARQLQEAASEDLCFACFDARLNKAAKVLGMQTLG